MSSQAAGFRVKSAAAKVSPLRRAKPPTDGASSSKEDLARIDTLEKKDGFRVASFLSGVIVVMSVVIVILLINVAGGTLQPAGGNDNPAAKSTTLVESEGNAVVSGVQEIPSTTPSPPFLSDFDTSRPLEKKSPSKILTRDEKQYRRAEAQYQVRVTWPPQMKHEPIAGILRTLLIR